MTKVDGLLWLLLIVGPLLILQRTLHKEIQSVFLLITRRADLSMAIFSLLFFPGVLLHEGSHYLMAKILGVPTGRISLIPESIEGNRLRLGFVETEKTDILRDALIGTAPLLAGGLFVAFAGIYRLNILALWEGLASAEPDQALEGFIAFFSVPDFWLWFYLIVTVSSMMFPSPSDRRAWLPVFFILIVLVGLAIFFGAGPWMSENLLPMLNDALRGVAVVFAISASVHLVVMVPAWFLRILLNRITGLQVQG